jgi:outer membrane immunogenic protein
MGIPMIVLRSLTLAAVAACVASGTALAGDLPSRSTYVPPADTYKPVANWQGPYAGVHLGGGVGRVGPTNTSGVLGGVQGGYNAQFDQVVVGGEADLTLSDVRNKSWSEKSRENWTGTARARAGYAFGNVLAYGTGGLAVGSHSYTNQYGKIDSTDVGYVIGAGAEVQVQPNVTVRGEYLYYSFGGTDYPSSNGPVGVDTHTNVFRAGANYKF